MNKTIFYKLTVIFSTLLVLMLGGYYIYLMYHNNKTLQKEAVREEIYLNEVVSEKAGLSFALEEKTLKIYLTPDESIAGKEIGALEVDFSVEPVEFVEASLLEKSVVIPNNLANSGWVFPINNISIDPNIPRITVQLAGYSQGTGQILSEKLLIGQIPLSIEKQVEFVIFDFTNENSHIYLSEKAQEVIILPL